MKLLRRLLVSAAVVLLAVAIAVSACSKKSSKVTNPGGGGGLELDSGIIAANGGGFQHTFNTAGTFPYHCTIHSAMTGNSVTVSTSSSVDSALVNIVSSSAPGFSPSAVTVKVGGKVRWVNTQ